MKENGEKEKEGRKTTRLELFTKGEGLGGVDKRQVFTEIMSLSSSRRKLWRLEQQMCEVEGEVGGLEEWDLSCGKRVERKRRR